MGNVCISKENNFASTSQQSNKTGGSIGDKHTPVMTTNASSSSSSHHGGGYSDKVVGELKSKRINPKKFCRPSRIIHEQVSMNQRDTVQSPIAVSVSSMAAFDRFSRRLSQQIQQFRSSNAVGQPVYKNQHVILRNLKDASYLFSRYEKLKHHDKQNIVKLDATRQESNEIYLTWSILDAQLSENSTSNNNNNTPSSSNKEANSLPCFDSLIQNVQVRSSDCVFVQHVSTSLYLQSNANKLFDPSSEVHQAQLVACGARNKLTQDQTWIIESLDEEPLLHVNQLFRLKHKESDTYLAQFKREVLCVKEDNEEEDGVDSNGNSVNEDFEAVRVSMTSPDIQKKNVMRGNPGDFESINLNGCEDDGDGNCKKTSKRTGEGDAITLLNSLTKSEQEEQIAGLINDEDDDDDDDEQEISSKDSMFVQKAKKPKQSEVDSLFRTENDNNNNFLMKRNQNNNNKTEDVLQAMLDAQVKNPDYHKNLGTDRQPSEIARKQELEQHRLAFFDKISKGQIWYIAEIVTSNESTVSRTEHLGYFGGGDEANSSNAPQASDAADITIPN